MANHDFSVGSKRFTLFARVLKAAFGFDLVSQAKRQVRIHGDCQPQIWAKNHIPFVTRCRFSVTDYRSHMLDSQLFTQRVEIVFS
jgi:hypothetical protein